MEKDARRRREQEISKLTVAQEREVPQNRFSCKIIHLFTGGIRGTKRRNEVTKTKRGKGKRLETAAT